MKRLNLILIFILISGFGYSQNAKRVSAYNELKNKKLDKAKKYIDEASENSSTSGESKTWKYKADVYYEIATSNNAIYSQLDTNAIDVATKALIKAWEIEDSYQKDNKLYIAVSIKQAGIEAYARNRYDVSSIALEKAYTYSLEADPRRNELDLLYFSGLSYLNINNLNKAKDILELAIKQNSKSVGVFSVLSDVYLSIGDTTGALQTIDNGFKVVPDSANYELLIKEINIYLVRKDLKKAEGKLILATEKTPNNPMLYAALANCYGTQGKFAEAETALLKALKIKPDFFDAYYDLGGLYYNDGVAILEDAGKLDLNAVAEYNKLKQTADERFTKAIPYLENALEINNNDRNTLLTLKQLYTRQNKSDKMLVVDGKLNEIDNKIEQAESFYKKAIAANAESYFANLFLGSFYLNEGEK